MTKKIILGITGSIAAYKAIDLAKNLIENNFEVDIVLSDSADQFISPLTLQSLFPKKVHLAKSSLNEHDEMLHINLAKKADYILIAPASANFISHLATGQASSLLSTICLASKAPILIAPAMNNAMWTNKFVQKNIQSLKENGVAIIGPDSGKQACGDFGEGRLIDIKKIIYHLQTKKFPQILSNIKILITSGPTKEKLDPVRYISNYSSGKMGYAVAHNALNMGAEVIFISGNKHVESSINLNTIYVESADEMLEAVKKNIQDVDIFIGTAAVVDYKAIAYSPHKIKKNDDIINLKLTKNPDIIHYVKKNYPQIFCVGFAAETNNIYEYGFKKLKDKNLDIIIINDVSDNKVFDSDYNEVEIISSDQTTIKIPKNTKNIIAEQLLIHISQYFNNLKYKPK